MKQQDAIDLLTRRQIRYTRDDGTPFTRLEMEQYLRTFPSFLIYAQVAVDLEIEHRLAYGNLPVHVLHAVLDKLCHKHVIQGEALGFKLDTVKTPAGNQEFLARLNEAVTAGAALPLQEGDGIVMANLPPPPPPPGSNNSPPAPGSFSPPPPPPAAGGYAAPPPPPPPPTQAAPQPMAPPPPPPPPQSAPQYQQPAAPPPPPYQAAPPAPPPPPPPPPPAAMAAPPAPPPPPAYPQAAAPPPPPAPPAPPAQATPGNGKRGSKKTQAAPPVPGQAPPPPQPGYAPPQPTGLDPNALALLQQIATKQQEIDSKLDELRYQQALLGMAVTHICKRAWFETWNVNPQTGQTGAEKLPPIQSMDDYKLESALRAMGFQDAHFPPR